MLFRFNGAIINRFFAAFTDKYDPKERKEMSNTREKKPFVNDFTEQSDNRRDKNHTHIELNRSRSSTHGKEEEK